VPDSVSKHTISGAGVGDLAAVTALVARLTRADTSPPRVHGGEIVVGPVSDDVARALDTHAARFAAEVRAGIEPDDVDLVDDAEWARLSRWSRTVRVPIDEPVHRLFTRWAEKQPDAVAVATDDTVVTYQALHDRAKGIALELRRRGVGTGDAVGVLAERGIDCVAAIVGVAVAGATAVPLDPAYPEPRLRMMLTTSGVHLTLTDDRPVPVGEAVSVTDIRPCAEPLDAATPEVATVMYTSGSTGTPKGVRITHAGIARLAGEPRIDFGPADAALHLAPVTFDAALLEIWCVLARGARLEIAPPGPLTLRELADVITSRGITVLWLTAGLFHQMAEHHADCFAGVRAVFAGGDVVSPRQVTALLTRHPGLTVVNGYGPTENTTFTTCHSMRGPLPAEAATIPIGTPVANTRVYVVDRGGHPVPPGVPGELWAAGDGLAAGYVGLPEQTAERFPVPTTGRLAGVRCYRTGDLARFRADGVLEFLGRVDDQVKVNGHRIELGEVEHAVLACPGVRGACVVAETDPLGGKRLAAHIVGDDPRLAKAVRAALRSALPAYLVPARYSVTDSLPLTANGKVDRARLRAGESDPR